MTEQQRRIRITYEIAAPESVEQGDAMERGFVDEKGESFHGPHAAAMFLIENGADQPSASFFHPGVWYTCYRHREDFQTGTEESRSYHLGGFTEEEERMVFEAITKGHAPSEAATEARRRIEDEYRFEGGVVSNPGTFEGEPAFSVYLSDLVLDGGAERTLTDASGMEVDGFNVDDELRAAFPEIGAAEIVAVWQDEQGFHHHKLMSAAEYDAWEAEQPTDIEP